MNYKRISGAVLVVLGVSALIFSNYITNQVNAGKAQIADGQSKVDQGNQLFSLNPVTKELGKGLTGSAQKQINDGRVKVAEYEQIAHLLYVGGLVAVVLGAGVVVLSFFGQKKQR